MARGLLAVRAPQARLSRPDRRWHATDVALTFALLVGLMLLQLTLVLAGVRPDEPLGLEAQAFRFFPTVLTAYAVLWFARVRGMTLGGFGFNRRRILLPAFFAWLVAVFAGPLIVLLLGAVGAVAPALAALDLRGRLDILLVPGVALLAFAVIVVAPVVEEITFRALLFRWLRQRWALWPAALLSGLVFAAFHLDASTLLPLTLAGAAFAWAYDRTGSLWASITPHAGLNALFFAARLLA